jgi:uncharacterized protein YqeY
MKTAMRSGDTERRDVLRYLRSVLGNKEIELRRPLSDEEAVVVIQTQIKQRSDAAELFRQANREDLVANEERQIVVLNDYLPEQLSEEDIALIVGAAADDLGVSSLADMGRLMPRLIRDVQGRADGRTLSRLACEELARRDDGSN